METAVKTTWKLDKAHSETSFKVKHMMISTVTGYFDDFNVVAKTANDNFVDAEMDFSAKIASVNTKNAQRDEHLRSADFFDSETYPEMTFTTTSFDGSKLVGDLTIKDITREVALNVDLNGIAVDPYGNTKAGFEITGTLNRKDFGLTWSAVTETGGVVVGDTVKLQLDLQLIKEQ